MKRKILFLLPALALVMASCDDPGVPSEEPTELTSVEKAVSALQSLDAVAISGTITDTWVGYQNGAQYSGNTYYEYVSAIWTEEYLWSSGSYSNETFYVNHDGVLADEYLSRKNEVGYNDYYYTSTGLDAPYLEVYPHPFAGIDASSSGVIFDESMNTLRIVKAFADDELYTLLSLCMDSYNYYYYYGGNGYLPATSIYITFDDNFTPLTLTASIDEVSKYTYGDYEFEDYDTFEYSGSFVSVSSLEDNVTRVTPLEPQEGQDGIGEILAKLASATSYTATFGSYSIKVVEDVGVLYEYNNAVQEGTFQSGDNYYLVASSSNGELVTYQDAVEGDAVEGYFENYTTYGVVPDFDFAQEVFDVVTDNGTSYKLNEQISASSIAYLLPVFGNIFSSSYTPVNTIRYSTNQQGEETTYDYRLTVAEGSTDGTYDFTVYLSYGGSYYYATVTFSDIDSTDLGYTNVNQITPTKWSEWFNATYYSYLEGILNVFDDSESIDFDDDVPFYFDGSNTFWELYDYTSTSFVLYAETEDATSVLSAYETVLTSEGWDEVGEGTESAVTYTNADKTLEIYLVASDSYIYMYVYPTGGSWDGICAYDYDYYETYYVSYGYEFELKFDDILSNFAFFNTYLGWEGFNLLQDNSTGLLYWVALSTYLGSSTTYAAILAALNEFYAAYADLYEENDWNVQYNASNYEIVISKTTDDYVYAMTVSYVAFSDSSNSTYWYIGATFTITAVESGS